MPKEAAKPISGGGSRRSFLAKLGLGAAALAALSVPFFRLGKTEASPDQSNQSKAFPGEDSIFHPAQDPRLDPRRKNQD